MKKSLYRRVLRVVILLLAAAVFLAPFYISFVYSMKTKQEITFTGLQLPKILHFENFTNAIEASNFFRALYNSVVVTVPTVLLLMFLCPMASHVLARNTGRASMLTYTFFLSALLIPYQAIMLPQYINLKQLGLLNTIWGAVLVRSAFNISYNILIFTSFIKSVPRELEEAAQVDGLNRFSCFWRIVFPLLKPVVATSIVINTLFSWNDFTISLTILMKEEMKTLPIMLYSFFGEYNIELGMAFAAFTLSMIPVLVLYFCLQRYIVDGITAGAVKG